jgi:Uma2 family endonuclease
MKRSVSLRNRVGANRRRTILRPRLRVETISKMPTAITETPSIPPPLEPPRKRWTRDECATLEASGIWDQQRLELVEGELISRMGKKRPHTNAMVPILAWLIRVFGEQYVNPETPIDVASGDNPINEPVPDIIVLARPTGEIKTGNPQPSELRLVVEISDSSVRFDLTVKARLYARAGIVEYWVVDIPARRIVVHRDPRDGQYRSVTAYSDQESVRPVASADHDFPVGSAFSD